jgi:hypothetical protein
VKAKITAPLESNTKEMEAVTENLRCFSLQMELDAQDQILNTFLCE